uniref:VscD n=1 Tax=Mycoplasma mycoides subsp. capri TaxID=40477 RepID=B9U3E0_MYCMC|nr:VscD [Mycoplasma mycoides subsp. capri]
MKKLLTILSSFGLIATTGASVVACKNDQPNSLQPKEEENEGLTSSGEENTNSNKEKEKEAEKAKLKSQITVLEGEVKRAEKLLKDIEQGIQTVEKQKEPEKFKENLEKLKALKPEIEKQLETAKVTKNELETRLRALESDVFN